MAQCRILQFALDIVDRALRGPSARLIILTREPAAEHDARRFWQDPHMFAERLANELQDRRLSASRSASKNYAPGRVGLSAFTGNHVDVLLVF
jgi:hypothetical protein